MPKSRICVGTVFVNHGEDSVCNSFSLLIEQQLGYRSAAPFSGDTYDLITGQCIYQAPVRPVISRKKLATNRAMAVYERLVAAGNRLQKIIEQNKGHTNKELSKFTNQILNLCEKYEK